MTCAIQNRQICLGLLAGLLVEAVVEIGCSRTPKPEEATGVPPAIASLLTEMRAANDRAKATYGIGFNSAMLKPIERLAGTAAPKDLLERAARHRALGEQMFSLDVQARDAYVQATKLSPNDRLWVVPELRLSCSAGLQSWDWRRER